MQAQSSNPAPVVIGGASHAVDAREIETTLAGQQRAWNAGEPLRESDFTAHSDYVTFDGTTLHGLDANQRLHNALARGVLRGSQLSGQIQRIRFITNEVAVVHSIGNLKLRFHRQPKPGRNSVQTTVMRRTAEGWKIETFHNTRIRRRGLVARLMVRLANRL